jgi:1-acyl-sn-glycerol-3-phosphate acyltransferase
MRAVRSVFFYVVLFLFTVYCGVCAYTVYRLTGRAEKAHAVARLWARVNLRMAGTRVHVEGVDRLKGEQAYIYAANHQSLFDIFALLAAIPYPFRWLAKEELFRIPVLGLAMEACGSIPIDRGDRHKAFDSINRAAERARLGASIFIFPEGTRSLDGILRDFKTGGFILAIKSQQPVVPVTISGSHGVMPKRGEWKIRPGVIFMRISDPIPTEGLTVRDRDRLIRWVRGAIRKHLPAGEGGIVPDERPVHRQV